MEGLTDPFLSLVIVAPEEKLSVVWYGMTSPPPPPWIRAIVALFWYGRCYFYACVFSVEGGDVCAPH